MSIRIVCPSCRKVYNLADSMQGKTVLCRECRSPMTATAPARKERRDELSRPADERIATSSRPASAAARTSRDDDEPRRRPVERRSRREDKESQGGKNLVPILLGVGAAVFVLVALVIGGVVFVSLRGKSNQTAAVVNETPANPVQGGGAPMPAAPLAAAPLAAPPGGPAKAEEAVIPPGPVPAEMAADTVKKVKQATAYLRVNMPGGEVAQGSGFLALERGIVITNAHVVGMKKSNSPPRSVEVVLHSGEAGEAKLAGKILGVDRDNDLAVLRVDGDLSRLPPPLPVDSAAHLTETQNVYIFGFPFGSQLGKNITISSSTISALRRGDDGVLKRVQVNGGMQPGNSGGPVTDARGVVVGVSVAIISGTQINFAIPGDFIRPLVERSKTTPLDLTAPPPGPLANNNPPAAGPTPGSGLAGDLAALKGTWQSEAVTADGGGASGTVKMSISPGPGSMGGRIHVAIATKQGGRTTSSGSTYSFTLQQKGSDRLLVTHISRKGRGMVFIYRFEGGRLILSGVVASVRINYTLRNVSMRRTSAEPENIAPANPVAGNPGGNPAAPPPPGAPVGGGKGSPAALKFSGDVYPFVAEAVRDKRYVDVDIRGFTLNKEIYRDVCAEGGVLIGFQAGLGKFVNNDILKSWRPIFMTKDGEKFGNWHGPVPAAPVTVKAKPGYVVSGMLVRSQLTLDALTLTFAKLGKDGLDLSDTYNSVTVGGNGGQPSTIGGNGALFIGVTGHLGRDGAPSSLGLVAVLPKN